MYTKKKSCEEAMPELPMINKKLAITETPTGTIIDFYLPRVIQDLNEFIDFLRAVRNAKADDTVAIHINCYGGDVDVAFNIIDVLNATEANTVAYVEGLCASAATMIMLAAKQVEITEHAHLMIHAWSSCSIGKWNEQLAEFEFSKDWFQRKFRNIYKNFLTEDEIDQVLAGTDMYLDAEDTVKRINKARERDIQRQEIVESIAAKYQEAINKELAIALKKFDETDTTKVQKQRKRRSK